MFMIIPVGYFYFMEAFRIQVVHERGCMCAFVIDILKPR